MTEKQHIWRKDITGLRALAVIPVLIFHAFPEMLPGGFYGVDIFFVISGYLISGIIFRGVNSNSFSFSDFYIKRIKRILPNLIAVIAFVGVIGWFVTTPVEYKNIGINIYRSAFFYQNLNLMHGEGYFNVLSQNNPLLHMWSLSVEEQFYIVFPVLCWCVWVITRYSVRWLGLFVVMITVCSLLYYLSVNDENVRFYFSPCRFWEIGVGICIAYLEVFYGLSARSYRDRSSDVISVLGFLLVFVVFFRAPVGEYVDRLFNVIAVFGGGLLILANCRACVNRMILSNGLMIFVGLISYSLYLWHWPLLAYTRIFFGNPDRWQLVVALVVSFLVAVVVYRMIENPIRRLTPKASVWAVCGLLIGLSCVYAMGKNIRDLDGIRSREIAQLLVWDSDWSYPKNLYQDKKVENLRVSNVTRVPDIVFMGDSHMDQYHARIMRNAIERNVDVGFFTGGGCMVSIGKKNDGSVCPSVNDEFKNMLLDSAVKKLVIAQKWGGYNNVICESINEYVKLIDLFLQMDESREVYFILDNPYDESENGSFDIMKKIGNRFELKEKLLHMNFSVPLPKNQEWQDGNKMMYEMLSENIRKKAKFIRVDQYICPNGICDLSNYKDNDHLRSSYVQEKAFWLDRVFNGL